MGRRGTGPAPGEDVAQPEPSDVELLQRLAGGDEGAFVCLYRRWQAPLHRFAIGMTGSPHAAEDVVQETFLKLMTGARQIEGRARLTTWLYRVAYNAAMDRLRAQKREVPVPSLLVDMRLSPEVLARDNELRKALETAIASLPTPLRAAFLLRDVEGLSTAEAAETLEITEVNLKVRLHRARLLLRERLSEFVAARGAGGGLPS